MTDASPDDGWRRLHPLSLAFSIGLAARRLLLPALAVLLVARGNGQEALLALLFVPTVLAALARYLSYRYRLAPEDLVIREGLLTRNERHVPYARIQNVDLVQSLLHRWFRVAEVRLETAGGEKPEAVMRVLSLDAVGEMRARVFAPRGAAESGVPPEPGAAAAPPRLVYRASLGSLVLLGLGSHRGLAALAAALGVLWQLEPLGYDERWLAQLLSRVDPGRAAIASAGTAAALGAAAALVMLLLVLKLLSVAWVVVRLYGFELRCRGDDLSTHYGLLTRVSATVPRGRIQHLAIRRGPLQRWLGRASVQVETAGRSGGEGGSEIERLWLAPMIAEGDVPALLAEAVPGVDPAGADWRPIASRSAARLARRGLLLAALATLAATLWLGPAALAVLVPAGLWAWVHARLAARHAGWAVVTDAALWRSGWWTRRTSVVPFEKIQVVALGESPFDRRQRMATVQIDTAGAGRVGHRVELRWLDRPAAQALADRLVAETSARDFRW